MMSWSSSDDDDELYWDGVVIGLQIDGDHSGGVYTSYVKDGDEFSSMWQSVQGNS